MTIADKQHAHELRRRLWHIPGRRRSTSDPENAGIHDFELAIQAIAAIVFFAQ